MLELKRVSTGYEAVDVIHDIDLTVRDAEIVALVGANGAGKSTLVKAISGIVPIRHGEITLDGRRIDTETPRARVLSGIAQVPEGRQVFSGLTVRENLRLGAYAKGADDAQIDAGIAKVGELFPVLTGRLDEAAANLSGGQQQMLGIGAACREADAGDLAAGRSPVPHLDLAFLASLITPSDPSIRNTAGRPTRT